jgi:hypothetical protein
MLDAWCLMLMNPATPCPTGSTRGRHQASGIRRQCVGASGAGAEA